MSVNPFFGMRVVVTPHAVEPIQATMFVNPPYSPHRSKRLWKKLRKRKSWPHPGNPLCYQISDTLFMHPTLYGHIDRLASEPLPQNSWFL